MNQTSLLHIDYLLRRISFIVQNYYHHFRSLSFYSPDLLSRGIRNTPSQVLALAAFSDVAKASEKKIPIRRLKETAIEVMHFSINLTL